MRRGRGARLVLLVAATGLLSGCGDDENSPTAAPPLSGTSIKILSGRADMVTDGDALVEVVLPTGAVPANLRVAVGGRDQSSNFALRSNGRVTGLVSGLAAGANVIEVTATNNSFAGARLTLTNAGINAPVLLSSHINPYICATPQPGTATVTNASGLSTAPTDTQCTTRTETKLYYRTLTAAGTGGCAFVLPDPSPTAANPNPTTPANSCFQPYVTGTTQAALIATTTPIGVTAAVPYIVRVERGVINRGIYDLAVLFDPNRPWTFESPQPQWAGKVVHNFGGSTGQPRFQARPNSSWVDDTALSRGYMVAVNSLTDSANNSNRVLVAETVMKMKEHIIEQYGELRGYIGNGASGGAINQNTVASIAPGLLDGLQIQLDFADSVTTAIEVSDCVQLVNFYAGPAWTGLMRQQGLSQAQINAKKTAINGHLDQLGCHSWSNAFGSANKPGNYQAVLVINAAGALFTSPTVTNNCRLPAAQVYDPASNPGGIRCSDPDAAIAVWGTAPGTNRANQTNDNVGVQYGLKALQSGAITAEEFVTLNEGVGGSDADSNLIPQRSTADAEGLRIAYRAGILVSGTQVSRVPIIDQRTPDEQGIHYNWRSFSQRDRLARDNGGNFGNQVIWRSNGGISLASRSLVAMDTWLNALNAQAPKASTNAVRNQAQILAAKPAAAFDFCYLSTDTSYSTQVRDFGICDSDPPLVIRSSPRQVAGGPRAEDILKCQLKALNFADYGNITFTTEQQSRLRAVFAGGVCDWSRPGGVNQEPSVSPLNFAAGPGGVPFAAEPVSTPI
ncbi:DUF6351 family protein [Sphingomonas faeni]|uniref:DUF6351 family protein n=1 Tax=Sphingomonas faeni TaxID=185950 RepID=UPI0027D7D0E1|nr:DUF6351 family protein [Sphingomonas faeni]